MSRSGNAAARRRTGPGDAPDQERKLPERRSPRAQRTRASLIAGARTVFEKDGFQNAKITEIAETAGVAIGSFYTHFRSKEEIFLAVMDEVEEEMLHPHRDLSASRAATLHESILAANRIYLEAYRRNAALMAVLEEFATVNEGFRAIRIRRAVAFSERNARAIERFQEKGIADPELDAYLAAHSLSGMVSRAAYQAFVLKTSTDDMDTLVRTLTRLWLNALGIGHDAWSNPT